MVVVVVVVDPCSKRRERALRMAQARHAGGKTDRQSAGVETTLITGGEAERQKSEHFEVT